jgi:hypothetical protein
MTPSLCRFTDAPLIRLPAFTRYTPTARNWSYDQNRAIFLRPHRLYCAGMRRYRRDDQIESLPDLIGGRF